MIEPRYLTVATCATYLGRTEKAVRQLVDKGRIPFAKVAGRVQFDVQRIDRWVDGATKRVRKGTA